MLFTLALLVSAVRWYLGARVFGVAASVSPDISTVPWFSIATSPSLWISVIVLLGLVGDVAFTRLYVELVTTFSDAIEPGTSVALLWSAYLLSGIVFVGFDAMRIVAVGAGWFDLTRSLMYSDALRRSDPALYFVWIEVIARLPLIVMQGSVVAAVVVRRLETSSWRACLTFAAPPAIGRLVPVAIGLAISA